MSLLTTAQVCGITGHENPLTEADVHAVVWRAYSPGRAELALAGRPGGRGSMWGRTGVHDGVFISCMSDGNGIWARIDGRAGHITWPRAERVLREIYLLGQLGLFALEVT